MIRKTLWGAALALVLSVIALQPAEAGLFNSRFDDFKKLVQAGNTEGAAALYARELDYFTRLKGDKRGYVDDVLAQRDQRYGQQLTQARTQLTHADAEPAQVLRWSRLKKELQSAQAELALAATLPARGTLTNDAMLALGSVADRITLTLQAEAPRALLEYGLFTEPSFEQQYPATVRWAELESLPAQFDDELGTASANRLAAFKKMYGDTLIKARHLEATLGGRYVAARISESGARSYLHKQRIRERAAKEGWQAGEPGSGVLLAAWPAPKSEVSSLQVAAPTATRYKLLTEAQTPERFIATGAARGYELVVFVRPSRIQLQRAESNQRQVGSQYQSGTRRIANPAYAEAEEELAQARATLAERRRANANASPDSSSSLGVVSAVLGATVEAAAENRVSSAERKLAATPQVIEEVVLSPYSYAAKSVVVKQLVASDYAVYDPETGKVTTGVINRVFGATFNVADAVRAEDPNRTQILEGAKTSTDVEAWIRGEIRDKYDDIWTAILAEYQGHWMESGTSTLGGHLLSPSECRKLHDRLSQEIDGEHVQEPVELSFFEAECVSQLPDYRATVAGWRQRFEDSAPLATAAVSPQAWSDDIMGPPYEQAALVAALVQWNADLLRRDRMQEAAAVRERQLAEANQSRKPVARTALDALINRISEGTLK